MSEPENPTALIKAALRGMHLDDVTSALIELAASARVSLVHVECDLRRRAWKRASEQSAGMPENEITRREDRCWKALERAWKRLDDEVCRTIERAEKG